MEVENKKEIMEMIRKAGSEEYETSWDEKGIPKSKKKSEIKKGRISRARGARFELKVRGDLEVQGWILDKWTNNLDLEENKIVKAKRKYNPFMKLMIIGTGFPDFIAFKKTSEKNYDILGIEVKLNGILSKIEKEKCKWYLKNETFSKILIAKKGEKKSAIEYVDFKERYGE
ncbi:MAG: hypothetical protein Q8O84_00315 [Nanoarchaeota archaeon]|nr:hypothetical protein [Nanoarchaeota archaeon]